MNKNDLLNLWAVLSDLQKVKANVKFSYAIAKNRHIIKSEVQAVQDAIKPAQEYIVFEQERIQLALKYADIVDGKPKIMNSQYIITEKLPEFQAELSKIIEKYAAAIEEQNGRDDEIESLLKEDIEIEPFKIEFEHLPDEIEPAIIETFIQCGLMEWE